MNTSLPGSVRVTGRTHPGIGKAHNEDSIGIAGKTQVTSMGDLLAAVADISAGVTCVIADGAGGHPAADQASRIVTEHLLNKAGELRSSESVEEAILDADRRLRRAMNEHPEWLGMGSTVAALLLSLEGVLIANVGDSAVFEIDDEGLVQLSVADHPTRPDWVPSERAATQLTQMLGGPEATAEVRPHLARYPLEPGMRFLLCSDGLTSAVTEDGIASIVLAAKQTAHELVDALVETAQRNGSRDDISVILVAVTGRTEVGS